MLKSDGEKLKIRVRDFFKKGHKSGNKTYDTGVCKDLAKAKKRERESDESVKHRPPYPGSDYDLAEELVKMPLADRSGNCGEMAALSAYYALKTEFINRNLIYIGAVDDPGDHAFCLVASADIKDSSLKFSTVTDFTKSAAAKSWLIIDPWLNVACTANDYLTEGAVKLNKWTAEGKRVAWAGRDGKSPNWYAPNGDYKDAMVNAPLDLIPF